MVLVVVDVETTGLSPDTAEIIELGAARWENGVVTDTFQALVRPSRPIPAEIQQLTSITQADVADAPALADVLPQFLSFIVGVPLAGHNVSFDIDFLRKACENEGYDFPTTVDGVDSLQLAKILLPTLQDFRLADVAKALQVQADGYHRALADAVTSAAVLTELQNRASGLPYVTLQTLERMASSVSPQLANWFLEVAERRLRECGESLPNGVEMIHQLAFAGRTQAADARSMRTATQPDEASAMMASQQEKSADASDLATQSAQLLAADSPIRGTMPGFQARKGQLQMVTAVSESLQGDQHLVVEAGTGTGKSLAYLVPATLFALATKERVVIATHTISLQDQIRDRDFPTLREVVEGDLSLAVLKGRTHYVCMRKLWQEIRAVGIGTPVDDIVAYMALVCWLVTTPEGNREELALRGTLADVWTRVQSETETCIGKRCPFYKPCYYFRARQQAYDANVVVTNHSLVLSDLKTESRVLPKYDRLVLDEAHHLEEEATKHLGEEVHLAHCMALFGRLQRDGGRHGVVADLLARLHKAGLDSRALPIVERIGEELPPLRALADETFQTLAALVPQGQSDFRITRQLETNDGWRRFLGLADTLQERLAALLHVQSKLADAAEAEADAELAGRLFDAIGFMSELASNLSTLCSFGDIAEESVQWIEKAMYQDRVQVGVYRAPIDVGRILADVLWGNKGSVILTSATLSTEGKFDFLLSRLGLQGAANDERLTTLAVASPFDIARQALLCVPTDVPELAKLDAQEAAAWLSDSLYQLARASGGRLLALFTSHAMLRATAAAVRQPLAKAGLQLFAQGADGSRTRILESFRNHPNSVLFGAQSFWEGIDLPGDQLTTLVIVRLPFAPPTHPVTAARHERLEQEGKSSFWAASLPDAVVRFRQGFGRLIRTVDDRGVVVVYDKRIVTTRYGSSFIKSLPGVRPFVGTERDVIKHVKQFLQATR